MSANFASGDLTVSGPSGKEGGPLMSQQPIGEREWIIDGVNLLPGRSAMQRRITERIPLQEEVALWDGVADVYEKDFRARSGGTAYKEIEEPVVISALNGDVDGKRILDVGAGPGYFEGTLFGLWKPSEVVALEPSARMVQIMQGHLANFAYNHRVRVVNAPIEESGLQGQFDIVVAINVLDVVSNLRQGLREINRLLPVGGRLVAMIRHPDRNRLMALKGTGDYHPGYASHYYEYWPGTGNAEGESVQGIWARYMETDQWNNELAAAKFWGYLHVPQVPSTIREKYPDMWEIYSRRPGALIFSMRKLADL